MDQLTLTCFYECDLSTIQYRIETLLRNYPELRGSDKALIEKYYSVNENLNTRMSQVKTNPETLIRLRRLVQSQNPDLKPEIKIEDARLKKEQQWRASMRQKEGDQDTQAKS